MVKVVCGFSASAPIFINTSGAVMVENKISNVIEHIEIKVGESNYEYKMLPFPIRNFNVECAVSPNNKWLILPNTFSRGFIVFSLFDFRI